MTIKKRLFLYSFGVVGLAALLIMLYFTLMLSRLYANQIEMDRVNTLKSVQTLQLSGDDQLIRQGLNKFETPNSVGSITLKEGASKIVITLAYSTIELDVFDPDLKVLVKQLYSLIDDMENLTEKQLKDKTKVLVKEAQALIDEKELFQILNSDLVGVNAKETNVNYQEVFKAEGSSTFHQVTDKQFIIETKVSDHNNMYTSYIGITREKRTIHLLMATAMTPKMTQLNQVIYSSLPMIVTVLLVIISLATILLSTILIKPLKKVSNSMKKMKDGNYEFEDGPQKGILDEYQQLEADLIALYTTLEHQKEQLATQNKRQDVFLKASSHQLKTPVTAALLLVDGMIAEVGKYREKNLYLPEVKAKLRSMEQIISNILLIDTQTKEEPQLVSVKLATMIQPLLVKQQDLLKDKSIVLRCEIDAEMMIDTDPVYFEQIIENLLTNAGKYTPDYETIRIYTEDSKLMIENYGSQLDEEWAGKLFEPFVRPPQTTAGHGLGLYLVAQYAELLGLRVTLKNTQRNSVIATVHFL